ncbi:MAG TPA: head GIN domain-containing protein [Chitinophagales bacterium]|nr:head GIN domain-containing protein [Chitinophagales bacterium]
MKTLFNCSLIFLSMVMIHSAVLAQTSESGKGTITTQTRNLGDYSGIALNVPATLSVSQSSKFSFRMEGRQELLDQVITEVKNSELVIKFRDNKWKGSGESTLRIFIELPAISGLEINGSGDIAALTDITTKNLGLVVNGSGDITMKKIIATTITAEINGSGSILNIAGNADNVTFAVNGSGDINADNLQSKKVSASATGSGDIAAGAAETLDINIAGSGDIFYKGNPASVNKNIVGSGNVSQR